MAKLRAKNGVGMPAELLLQEFGSMIWAAFDEIPYRVGSSMRSKSWRDVDVRLILSDEVYENLGFLAPEQWHRDGKWQAMCLAFSALGRQMTGLPIDFQIQPRSWANKKFGDQARSALGHTPLRMKG
jgi:hypothetical protein